MGTPTDAAEDRDSKPNRVRCVQGIEITETTSIGNIRVMGQDDSLRSFYQENAGYHGFWNTLIVGEGNIV
jgi:hypothetical protein